MPNGGSNSKLLSLCMIVKNEEEFIRGCLSSIRDVVDEIIIVDTGSNDETIDICRSFGAVILKLPWNNYFAAARNHGLRHATGEWILWLDADEEMDPDDALHLRDVLVSAVTDFFAVRLINYYGETANLDETYQISHLRIFRNRQEICFVSKIHEHLNTGPSENITTLPIRIYHYGYMPSIMDRKDKRTRNIQLLQNELQNPHYSPWIHYHLASEYYNIGELKETLKQLDIAVLKFVFSGLKPPSMIYRLKYMVLFELKETSKALPTIDKALAIYPDYVDLHFIKGLLLLDQQRYRDAESAFRHCTSLGEDNGEYLTLRGVGSFQAWYYVGQCLEAMGQLEGALQAYQQSLANSPVYQPSVNALRSIEESLS